MKNLFQMTAILMVFTLFFSTLSTISLAEETEQKQQEPEYTSTKLIVKYKDGYDWEKISKALSKKEDLKKAKKEKEIAYATNMELIDVNSINVVDDAVDFLNKTSGVEYAVPDYPLSATGYETEPLFHTQWALNNNGQTISGQTGIQGVDIDLLPALTFADGDVLIGVMDTGINENISELEGRIDPRGYNFVDDNEKIYKSEAEDDHGTQIAGIIAAANNAEGIVGVAAKAKILPLKILKGKTGTTSDAIEAIAYAEKLGVKIMNCSFSSSMYNFALKDAMQNADMLFVCAAGNDGNGGISYPAAFGLRNVISVGAIDNQGHIADFVSNGAHIDLYAPGVGIQTVNAKNEYVFVKGTSYAAAHVTGVAALVLDAVPQLRTDGLAVSLKSSGEKNGKDVVDAYQAVKNALPYQYMDDESGSINRAMRYINRMITPDVAEILVQAERWSTLNQTQKQIITDFFGVTDAEMALTSAQQLNIIDCVALILAAKQAHLALNKTIEIYNRFTDKDEFDREMEAVCDLTDRLVLSETEMQDVTSLLIAGEKIVDIGKALIVSRVMEMSLTGLYTREHGDFSTFSFETEQKDILVNIATGYNVSEEKVDSYLKNKSLLPTQLFDQIYAWQQENNFYVIGTTVAASVYPSEVEPGFSQYQISKGNWEYDSGQIDQITGMLRYTQPIISLAGKNELGLDLNLRFDSDSALLNGNVKASDSVSTVFTVTEHREYYKGDHTRDGAKDRTILYTCNTEKEYLSYINADQSVVFVNADNDYYIRNISVSANATGMVTDTQQNNFYDQRYGLGVGWALNLPTIEFVGNVQYLHLPDGEKYKINGSKLEGYRLNDLTFGTSNAAEFTVGGVGAAYKYTDAQGTKYFFDATGKYLGAKDIFSNIIKVYYNADGLIDKIVDTTNRYIQFTYMETAQEEQKTVSITLFDNTQTNPESALLYTLTLKKDSNTGAYYLKNIKDALNREKSIDYMNAQSTVTFNGMDGSYQKDAVYIDGVQNESGYYVDFDYTDKLMAYGYAGTISYKAVNCAFKRESKTASAQKELETFNYLFDNTTAWRYQQNKIWPVTDICYESSNCVDAKKTTVVFDDCLRLVSTKEFDTSKNRLIRETQNWNFNSQNQPIASQDFEYGETTDIYTMTYTTCVRDAYGNTTYQSVRSGDHEGLYNVYDAISIFDFDYTISKTIPEITAEFTKEDLQEGNRYATVVFNTIDQKKNKITADESYTYDMPDTNNLRQLTNDRRVKSLSKTENTYLSNGMLSTSKATDLQTGESVVTEYHYDTKYGVYDAIEVQHGVLDVDGNPVARINNSTDICTFTKYDMRGNVTQTIDAYGNPSRQIYNAAGELAETITPFTAYEPVEDWESYTKGTMYPADIGLNSGTTSWNGDFEIAAANDTVAGSTKVLMLTNTSSTTKNLRAAISLPSGMLEDTYGMRFWVKGAGKGIRTEIKGPQGNYVLFSSAPSDGGYIHVNWSGEVYKNGPDIWKYMQGSNDYFENAHTLWIQFSNVEPGTSVFLDDIEVLKDQSETIAPTKQQTIQDYDQRVTTILNADGTGSKLYYDAFGNVTSEYKRNAEQGFDLVAQSTFDERNRQKTRKDYLTSGKYNLTTYTYNQLGDCIQTKITDQDGTVLSLNQSIDNGVVEKNGEPLYMTTEMIADGATVYYYSDGSGNSVLTETVNDDVVYSDVNEYEGFGHLYQSSGETQPFTAYVSDSTGNDVITNQGYHTMNNSRDYDTVDLENVAVNTVAQYNGFGQLIEQTDPNNSLQANLDDPDQIESQIAEKTTYDVLGRVIKTETPVGKNGNDIVYSVKKIYYDAQGRVAVEKTDTAETRYTYDCFGNTSMVQKVNRSGNSQYTQYVYDNKNQLIRIYSGLHMPLKISGPDSVSGADGDYSVIAYTYDFDGNKTSYTDALGQTETYEYEKFTTNADSTSVTDRMVKKTLRDGSEIFYSYDNNGNVLQVVANKEGKDTITKEFTYNLSGSVLTEKTKRGDTVEYSAMYTYDDLNRCVREETIDHINENQTYIKEYEYNGENMLKFTLSEKTGADETVLLVTETYAYNQGGLLTNIAHTSYKNGKVALAIYVENYYDANGNLGMKITDMDQRTAYMNYYEYNLANQVTEMVNQKYVLSIYPQASNKEVYTYSADGNLTRKEVSLYTPQSHMQPEAVEIKKNYTNYTYDDLNRLTSEEYGVYTNGAFERQRKDTYTFDDSSNIKTKTHTDYVQTENGYTAGYTYDAANRLIGQTSGTDTYRYMYDAGGNLLKEQKQTDSDWQNQRAYTYDALGRTESIAKSGVVTTFRYDAQDNRIQKTTGGTAITSVWNNGQIVYDLVEETDKTFSREYAPDNSFSVVDHAPVISAVNPQGDVIEDLSGDSYAYDAYGNSVGALSESPYTYRGYYFDAETGLYYLNARYYDPEVGRFTQEDTYQEDNLEYNFYGYCSANPVLYQDPTGHYKGQDTRSKFNPNNTSGGINNPKKYLEDRYGGTATKNASKSLGLASFTMAQIRSGNICSPVAITRVLHYYRHKKGYKKIDSDYKKIFKKVWATNGNKDGTNPTVIDNMAQKTLRNYGYKRSISYNKYAWNFASDVVNEINKGYPVIFSMANGYYGNHTVTVIGYEVYKIKKKLWIGSTTKYRHLIKVYDGWKDKPRYIDYEAFAGSIFNPGIGSFTRIRVQS